MKKPPLWLDFNAHWEIIAAQQIGNGNFCCFIAHPHSTRVLMAHKTIMCLSSSLLTLFTLQMRTTKVKKIRYFCRWSYECRRSDSDDMRVNRKQHQRPPGVKLFIHFSQQAERQEDGKLMMTKYMYCMQLKTIIGRENGDERQQT